MLKVNVKASVILNFSIDNKKLTILLTLRSISFLENRSFIFTTKYRFYAMKEMDWQVTVEIQPTSKSQNTKLGRL